MILRVYRSLGDYFIGKYISHVITNFLIYS